MRRIGSFLALLLFTSSALGQVTSPAPANPLQGSWRLVSQKLIYPDSTVNVRGTSVPPSTKILNDTHFAFGYQTEDGEEVYAGGGRYTLEGDSLYTEHIEYHSSIPNVGQSLTFKYRVEGNRWYHTGQIGNFVLEEVWERIK